MDEPDLSFIKSDIKLEETAPLNRRRVVALFNCYLMKMADFLNDFVQRAERLILEAERQLYVADTKLKILESKLAHIPEGSPVTICTTVAKDTTSTSQLDHHENQDLSESTASPVEPSVTKTLIKSQNKEVLVVNETASTTSNSVLLVKDDPLFAKYFKMLKMGVVEQAVKVKMMSEGFEPSLLDTPNAPSPGGIPGVDVMQNPTAQTSFNSNAENTSDAVQCDKKLVEINTSDSTSSFSDSD